MELLSLLNHSTCQRNIVACGDIVSDLESVHAAGPILYCGTATSIFACVGAVCDLKQRHFVMVLPPC